MECRFVYNDQPDSQKLRCKVNIGHKNFDMIVFRETF